MVHVQGEPPGQQEHVPLPPEAPRETGPQRKSPYPDEGSLKGALDRRRFLIDNPDEADNALYLEHGKPLIFGKDRNKGIRLHGLDPEVVELGNGITVDDLLIHDEKAEEPSLAYLLSRMVYPRFPECIGVFRAVQRPTYDELLNKQIADVQKTKGKGKIEDLFTSDDVWVVQ